MLDNIPIELHSLRQWVVWKYSCVKNGKRPYNAKTGKPASTNDPKTWSSYMEAKQAVINGNADGVGFVLTENDPYTVIDLDNVIANGEIEDWAKEIIERFDSYTEVSQSGKGIHIFIDSKKVGERSRSDKVEIYHSGQYIALTGNLWNGQQREIEYRGNEMLNFYKEFFTDGAICEESENTDLANQIVLQENAEPPADKLMALYPKGNFTNTWNKNRGFASFSEYDLALSVYAVEDGWSDQEIADLIVAFRRRYGEEKDTKKALRKDYIARTITKARNGITAEYKCDLTDVGNAKRLILRHGANLKYCYSLKKWLIWDSKQWEIDETGQIIEFAKETIRSIYIQAAGIKDSHARGEFIKAIRRIENNSRIAAMITLAQSLPGTPVLAKQLDTNPWKLNVNNGAIDLTNGELHPHNRDDLITKLIPVDYVPDSRSKSFEDFLMRVLPDEEVRKFVQRVAGYTLYGRNEEEIMLFIYGPPASGKSTFLAAIRAAMGDYAAVTDFGTFLKRERSSGGPRADIARLAGCRLVISLEAEEGAKLDEPLVNQLTGMDMVTARHLYQESFEFLPQFTIWLSANSRPQVRSPEGGIWRRIREIPFNQVIPDQKRNLKLKSELCEEPENRTGILNWMVEGYLAWQKEGLRVPEAVREATDEYRDEMDFIGQFLEECTIGGPGLMTKNRDMRNAYTRWCKRNGIQPLGSKTFSQSLKLRGLEQVSGGDRSWKGIELIWDGYSDMQIAIKRKN